MLNLNNTLCVFTLLGTLKWLKEWCESPFPIALHMRIKHSRVKECILTISPETSHLDVSSSVWFCIGRTMTQSLPRQWQQWRINLNVIVHFIQTFRQKVRGVILWCILIKPASLQICECWMEYQTPHKQLDGRWSTGQLYQRCTWSRKSDLHSN